MKPKKGDLGYKRICEGMTALYFYETGMSCNQPNEEIATDSDLAEMGLVRLRYKTGDPVKLKNGFHRHVIEKIEIGKNGRPFYCLNQWTYSDDDIEPWIEKPNPQPHVWKVGQYAKCPDGKTRRVTYVNQFDVLHFHDDSTRIHINDCTLVPEPERPELPMSCRIEDDGRITDSIGVFTRTLDQWIPFHEGYDCQKHFINLRDWRILTGRMV